MKEFTNCPVCMGKHGGALQWCNERNDVYFFECNVCGQCELTLEGYVDELKTTSSSASDWTDVRRAALSHALRTQREIGLSDAGQPNLTSSILKKFRKSGRTLPIKLQQANNIIQYVGNYEHEHGLVLPVPEPKFYACIGAINPDSAVQLVIELTERGLVRASDVTSMGSSEVIDVSLTLDGWERWEKERSRENTSNVGMIAMKFDDEELEEFVKNVIKPAVKEIPGLSLEKLNDNPKTGILDVIMRQMIRDSAFVIADLSHANNGAYWEAGFAEGLGKPVIYICEQSVWEKSKTHFDTNHCTTIIYEKGEEDKFRMQLIATLKNSLNLFR